MADPAVQEEPDAIDREVGRRVRQLRRSRGLSQTGLGESAGVTFQQIQKYERGTNRISTSMLVSIARAMKIPLSELLADFDQPTEGSDGWEAPDVPGVEALAEIYAAIDSAEARQAVLAIVRLLAAEPRR